MGNCNNVETPIPTDPINNPCGQFISNEEIGLELGGYSMLPVLDSGTLSIYPQNYCIPYGPFLTIGVGVFIAIGLAIGILAVISGGLAAAAFAPVAAAGDTLSVGLDLAATSLGEGTANLLGFGTDAAAEVADGGTVFGDIPELFTEDNFDYVYKKAVSNFKSIYYALDIASALIDLGDELNTISKLGKYANQANSFCESIGTPDEFGNPQWISYFNPQATSNAFIEWVIVDQKSDDSCTTLEGDSYHEFSRGSGCCKGGCARPGKKPKCVRNKKNTGEYVFAGNPLSCCFADYRINSTDDINTSASCYEDPASKRRTCSPLYRDLSGVTCQEIVTPYCLGEKLLPNQDDWMEMWLLDSEINLSSIMQADDTSLVDSFTWKNIDSSAAVGFDTIKEMGNYPANQRFIKSPCLTAIARAMYSQSDLVRNWQDLTNFDLLKGTINPSGYAWAQNLLNLVFKKYQEEYGSFIGEVDQDGYLRSSKFIDLLQEICSKFPQLCQTGLKGFCSKVSARDLPYIQDGQMWCGCFLPDKEYAKYDKLGIPRECNPLCNASGNIPLTDSNFVAKTCRDTTCVIDELTVDIVSSRYPNGFDFNQLCRSCGEVNVNEVSNQILLDSGDKTNSIIEKSDSPAGLDKGSLGADGIIYPYTIISNGVTSYPSELSTNFKLNGYQLLTQDEISSVKGTYVSQEFFLYSEDVDKLCRVTFNILQNKYVDSNNITHTAWGIVGINPIEAGTGYTNKLETYPFLAIEKNIPNISNFTGFKVITISIRMTNTQRSVTKYDADDINTISNTCTCIISDGTIDSIDSNVRGLNLSQNCGSSNCTNAQGNTIACSSNNSSGFNNIGSFKDSISSFQEEQVSYRLESVLIVLILICVIFLIAFYAIMN